MADDRPRSRTRTLIRSTGIVMAIRGLDFGFSFLVSVLLANRFGASGQLDAFFLARRTTVGFADTIRKLVGQVVLPPVVAAIDRGEAPSVHALSRRLWWFIGGFALLTATGTLLPSVLVSAFAPGFSGERRDLTATMMAIMMPLLPLAVLASLLAAVLQAKRRYLLSEGTNLVQRALLVLVLAVAVPPVGIIAGAWTMLVAGVIGFVILLAGAWGIVRHPPPPAADTPAVTAPKVAAGGGLLAAIVLNAYFQATTLMDFAFASTTSDGGVAALEYGARLVSLVPGLVMGSLYTVLMPDLIRAVQHPDPAVASAGIQRFQRIALFAQLPVSVGMMLGAELMVAALFGHGAFDARAIEMTAATTAGYAAAAIFLAPFSAITSAIYSDPRGGAIRPLATIAGFGIAVRLAMLFVAAPIWGAPGIAWAAVASTALAGVFAQVVAARRFARVTLRGQAMDFARSGLCALIATGAGMGLLALVPGPASILGELALLAALGGVVLGIYALAAIALHVPEVAAIRIVLSAAIARRRRKGQP